MRCVPVALISLDRLVKVAWPVSIITVEVNDSLCKCRLLQCVARLT